MNWAMRRMGWALVVLALDGAVVAAALGSRAAAPANPTFTLVPYPKAECPSHVIVGRACVDRSGQVGSQFWKSSDGSANWHSENWTTTYAWTVPDVVPPAGAGITMTVTSEVMQGGVTCPGMGAGGGFPLKTPGQEVQISVCANEGEFKKVSKTLKVVSPSGGPAYIVIGLGDGPRFTYKYEAAKSGCARQKRSARPADVVVKWGVSHHGVPARGESPTLVKSTTVGGGTLTICLAPGARSGVATSVSGVVVHEDVHELPTSGTDRTESLRLAVTRGAYGKLGPELFKVALDVEVTKSNDTECPVGSRGRLSLTDDEDLDDNIVSLRLCGQNHTHTFKPEDDVDVVVSIDGP